MIIINSLSLLLVASCTGSSVIRIDPNRNTFPIEYFGADDLDTLPGVATLTVTDPMAFGFTPSPRIWLGNFSRQVWNAVGFRILNTPVQIVFDEIIQVPVGLDPALVIGATPTTLFSQNVSGFLLSPLSAHEASIVFNPNNVSEYVYGNEIFYSPNFGMSEVLGEESAWRINTRIQSSRDSYEWFSGNCSLSLFEGSDSEYIPVPTNVMTALRSEMANSGIQVSPDNSSQNDVLFLFDFDESRIESLPTIKFVVLTENGQDVQVGSIEPSEYIRPTWEDSVFRVLLRDASGGRLPESCLFPPHILRNIVLHFDTQNNRVGFGDPLAEF